jgi:ADP-ribose pyrophosphatase
MGTMPEQTLSSTRVWVGRLIAMRIDEVQTDDGHHATREIVEHPGAVGVLAWDGERLALVRQWRHAVGDELLEIPAGTLEPDEEPEATARRELAEEVGVRAEHWERGPSFFTAPGFCTERLTLFLATGLAADDAAAPLDEHIERVWLTLEQALGAIDQAQVTDAKSLAGIWWLARRLGGSR